MLNAMHVTGSAFAREAAVVAQDMRRDCLSMALQTGNKGSHIASALSIVEILAVLYTRVMRLDNGSGSSEYRDRFILSKGHGAMAFYAALRQVGLVSEAELLTFKSNKTSLYGHPSQNPSLGIDFSSGSLGLGLSQGLGTVLGLRLRDVHEPRVFVLLGDGECNEGSVWEAAMAASHFNASQLVAIIDMNGLQYDGDTREIMEMDRMSDRWRSFGWHAVDVDGHDVSAVEDALCMRRDKPLAVVARTVKGKGVSFMESDPSWHHRRLTEAEYAQALSEVNTCR